MSWWLLAVDCSAGTNDFRSTGDFILSAFPSPWVYKEGHLGTEGNMSVGYRSCKKRRTVLSSILLVLYVRDYHHQLNLVWVHSPRSPWTHLSKPSLARTCYPAVCIRSHGILPARYALFGVFAADCSRRVSFSVTRVNMLINSSRSVPASITTSTRFLPFLPSSPSRQSRSLHHETYACADTSFLNISSSCSIIMIALGSTPAGHFMSMSLSEAGYSA